MLDEIPSSLRTTSRVLAAILRRRPSFSKHRSIFASNSETGHLAIFGHAPTRLLSLSLENKDKSLISLFRIESFLLRAGPPLPARYSMLALEIRSPLPAYIVPLRGITKTR